MELATTNPRKIRYNSFNLENTTFKTNLADVFDLRMDQYLNEYNLFIAHFNRIPNFIHEKNINCKKANQWFLNNYNAEIKDCYYDKIYFNQNKKAELNDIFYFLFEDLMVYFDTVSSRVRFLFRVTEESKVNRIIRRSLEYAWHDSIASFDFVTRNAREMESSVMNSHIKLYVNEFTMQLGQEGKKAVRKLFEVAKAAGVIPDLPEKIFLTN